MAVFLSGDELMSERGARSLDAMSIPAKLARDPLSELKIEVIDLSDQLIRVLLDDRAALILILSVSKSVWYMVLGSCSPFK